MDLRNRKVTVVGLGNSGVGSALLLNRIGAIVSVTDNSDNENVRKNAKLCEQKYIEVEIGKHTNGFLSGTELLVVSPGIEKPSPPIHYAMENHIPIISELELGFLFCNAPIVAVTGTNGKSTVVSLLGEILARAGFSVNVCGNIGNSLSGEIYSALSADTMGSSGTCQKGEIDRKTIVILETSSFQLEWIESFRPKISAILNVTEDHLDRYRNFEDYLAAKKRIFENQKADDITILNYDDKNLRDFADSGKIASRVFYFSTRGKIRGIYLDKGDIKIFLKNRIKSLFKLDAGLTQPLWTGIGLKGEHNVENILASTLIATLLGADKHSIEKAVKDFTPLAHRFEKVTTIEGIEFIDDSKATNVDSTYRALLSLEKPTILIAGGKDKNLSYEKVIPAVKNNVKKIVLIGETKHKIRDIFKGFVAVEEKDSLEEAVEAAYRNASYGDCVLLSPMCSSFDMFRDYKHRGEVFRTAVENLKVKSKFMYP